MRLVSPLSRPAFLTASMVGLASWIAAAEPRAAEDLGRGPCATATSRASLAPGGEAGARLVVRGRLFNFADDPFLSAGDRERSAAAGRLAWIQAPRQEGEPWWSSSTSA